MTLKFITAQGNSVDLSAVSASGRFDYEEKVVVYLQAKVAVYTPVHELSGGQQCFHAVCNHSHPDTEEGRSITRQCCDRLSNIINTGKRIPKWATLHNG